MNREVDPKMHKPAIVLDPGHGGWTSYFYDLDNGVRVAATWEEARKLPPSEKTYFDPEALRRWEEGGLAIEPRYYFERNGRRITWGDPGDVSPLDPRICEKDLALDVSRSIHREIGRDLLVKATRDRDGYVAVESRVDYANRVLDKHGPSVVFVSLHTESSRDPNERGLRMYHPPKTENELLECFAAELEDHVAGCPSAPPLEIEAESGGCLDLGRWGDLEMPWLTVVLGFLSNMEDAQRLLDRSLRQGLARALARGAMRYLGRSDVRLPSLRVPVGLASSRSPGRPPEACPPDPQSADLP